MNERSRSASPRAGTPREGNKHNPQMKTTFRERAHEMALKISGEDGTSAPLPRFLRKRGDYLLKAVSMLGGFYFLALSSAERTEGVLAERSVRKFMAFVVLYVAAPPSAQRCVFIRPAPLSELAAC